jgi:hypothetical protein
VLCITANFAANDRSGSADAAASQFSKASASTFPLLPGDGAQPPPGPLINRVGDERDRSSACVGRPPKPDVRFSAARTRLAHTRL